MEDEWKEVTSARRFVESSLPRPGSAGVALWGTCSFGGPQNGRSPCRKVDQGYVELFVFEQLIVVEIMNLPSRRLLGLKGL